MNRIKFNDYLNSIKDASLKNAIMSHGVGEGSNLSDSLRAMSSNEQLKNTTEPRMKLYTAEINKYLYADNSFITKSQNDAAFAASGEVKVLNDAAAGTTVTKGRVYAKSLANNANAPTQTVKIRKNSNHEWAIEYFHTTPQAISMELTSEVPYEARQDLLNSHADVMMQAVANFTAVEWSQGEVGVAETLINPLGGSDKFLFTSGTDTRTTSVVGATGTVKKMVKADLQNVKSAFTRQHMTQKGKMYFLPTVEQYSDILEMKDFVDYEKTGQVSKLIMGEVGLAFGITILDPRHREDWGANVLYTYTALSTGTTSLTKIEDTASSGANMASAGLFWIDSQVKRAQGSAVVFPWLKSPIYMGDVYASEMRYGAIKKRGDAKGVVMLLDNPFTS